jgi:uncharacterized protein YlzI (FlbEa/FlbD family)
MRSRSIRRISLAMLMTMLSSLLLVPSTLAAGPLHDGPYTWDETIYFPDFCAEAGTPMEVTLETHGWQAFTLWADENGTVQKAIDRERAPHDVFTNLETGRQMVVRGEFQEIIERIPGTDEYTKTISGFRYLINEPGRGVEVQEVGRIVYADLQQTLAIWQAGKHDLVYDNDFAVFCDILSQPA